MVGTDFAQWGVIITFLVGVTTLFLNIRRRDRERDQERGRPDQVENQHRARP